MISGMHGSVQQLLQDKLGCEVPYVHRTFNYIMLLSTCCQLSKRSVTSLIHTILSTTLQLFLHITQVKN